jgi:hypothetical protein
MAILTPRPLWSEYSGNYTNTVSPNVLAADPDIVLVAPETLPVDVQAQLILQDMGGTELIMFARHDTVDGQTIVYQPIKDVDLLASRYSPWLITGYSPSFMTWKNGFGINLDTHAIADDPNVPGSLQINKNVSGNGTEIIVSLNSMQSDYIVEFAFSTPEEAEAMPYPVGIISGGNAEGYYDGEVVGGDALGYNIDITVNGGAA